MPCINRLGRIAAEVIAAKAQQLLGRNDISNSAVLPAERGIYEARYDALAGKVEKVLKAHAAQDQYDVRVALEELQEFVDRLEAEHEELTGQPQERVA